MPVKTLRPNGGFQQIGPLEHLQSDNRSCRSRKPLLGPLKLMSPVRSLAPPETVRLAPLRCRHLVAEHADQSGPRKQ